MAPFSHNISLAWAEIYVITIAISASLPETLVNEAIILKKLFKFSRSQGIVLFGRHVQNSNSSESTYLLEFFSVRQFWHFCQYCVKYLLLIIVQMEKY